MPLVCRQWELQREYPLLALRGERHTNMQDALDHAEGDASTTEFQSLSATAALALALGLASFAALATPLLIIVPVAAILAALLAFAKIRTAGGGLTGTGLARWGLALGIACLAATIVRAPVRDALMHRQASQVGRQWLDLIAEGRRRDALLIMSGTALSALAPPPASPEAPPPKPEDVEALMLENLRINKTAERLAALKRPLSIAVTPAGGEWPAFDGKRTLMMEDYDVTSASGESCRVQVRLARTAEQEATGTPWRVDSWAIQDAEAEQTAAAIP